MEVDRLATASKALPTGFVHTNSSLSTYTKLDQLKSELLQTQNALTTTSNPLTKKERAQIVSALSRVGIKVVDPASGQDEGCTETAESDVEMADDEDHDEEEDEMPDVEREQTPPADDAPELVQRAYRVIMSNSSLRAKLRFDLAPFLLRVHENVTQNKDASKECLYGSLDYGDTIKMYGGGKTQARKTPLKLCAFVMCRMIGVATIVLTTNTSGRDDLFGKFLELLGKLEVPTVPSTIPTGANDTHFRYYREKEVEEGRETMKIVLRKSSSSAADLRTTALAEGVIAINDMSRTEASRMWACRQLSQGACLVVNNTAAAIGT